MNLHGEFTCGQKDQGANVLGGSVFRRFSVRRFRAQHLDDRNQERESLAGAGLGGADYVLAFKGWRNGFRLDGGEGNELSCRQFLLQGSRQGQFRKCCHSMVFFLEGPSRFSDTVSRLRMPLALKLALEPNGGQEMRKWSGSNRIPA